MALPSTYHLNHSLPNRSPTQRPRSLSLSEYQPLNFDRDALESAYQQSLNLPSSHSSSLTGHTGSTANSLSFNGLSTETHSSSGTSTEEVLTHPKGAFAGVGAGHTLTPPQSPLHQATSKLNQATLLSPIPSTPIDRPPTPPPRPNDHEIPETTFPQQPPLPPRPALKNKPSPPRLPMRRSQSEVDMVGYQQWDGANEYIQGDGHGRTKRRALPAVPTNVPVPEPPQWEPDYKPQIPPELTAPSASYAYASLSAPPPNLPPRRNQRVAMGSAPGSSVNLNLPGPSGAGPSGSGSRPPIATGPSVGTIMSSTSSGSTPGINLPMASPPAGAPDYPPQPSAGSSSSASSSVIRPRRDAEKEVLLRAQERMSIWSTHYLDPSLRQSLIHVPHQVTNAANIALSGLSSGPKEKYNSTIGAPIDGLAKMAKEWVVNPDARFIAEHGGIELGLGVINSLGTGTGAGQQDWERDKGRKKARVEASSRTGGIKVDLLELDKDRQIDLKIETKSGDVLVLLPDEFHGPIHITSPRPPEFLPIIAPLLKPLSNPYSNLYTTFMVPLSLSRDARQSNSVEYNSSVNIERHLPKSFKEQSDLFDQLYGGYIAHSRIDHSKITIRSDKGRVVLACRGSKDERDLEGMGLRVGVKGGEGKRKRWWRM
ncbi:hypothetical protein I302_107780 [Kwoniella bestiolae CBS 10118]|uniref:DUF7330 domain-containing protein n=1 Tax=Kwoniella bestiolae CBS 10118 TaxID=1296100 RepID=A0A1B9FXJ9_9TREE|nr:hypothetical protein I302_06482 [Kwoniella bestiolae CBS 10118]OCF23499.1 hypothetical protein I302_06482 [Kwoniella bestiolae CBS 10118]